MRDLNGYSMLRLLNFVSHSYSISYSFTEMHATVQGRSVIFLVSVTKFSAQKHWNVLFEELRSLIQSHRLTFQVIDGTRISPRCFKLCVLKPTRPAHILIKNPKSQYFNDRTGWGKDDAEYDSVMSFKGYLDLLWATIYVSPSPTTPNRTSNSSLRFAKGSNIMHVSFILGTCTTFNPCLSRGLTKKQTVMMNLLELLHDILETKLILYYSYILHPEFRTYFYNI
ncbi:hypothetical protein ABKN59_006771 [Abortiporus biennis]